MRSSRAYILDEIPKSNGVGSNWDPTPGRSLLLLADNSGPSIELALEGEPWQVPMHSLTSKAIDKDKDSFDFKGLAKSLKQINNEVSKLKRKTSDTFVGGKVTKPFFRKTNNPPPKTPQGSSTNFNVEELGKDNFYTFHQTSHYDKTYP